VPNEVRWLVCFGRATGPLVAAARKRGIPFRRLDGESLVQLGHGLPGQVKAESTTRFPRGKEL
jgi:hypothetical protein